MLPYSSFFPVSGNNWKEIFIAGSEEEKVGKRYFFTVEIYQLLQSFWGAFRIDIGIRHSQLKPIAEDFQPCGDCKGDSPLAR